MKENWFYKWFIKETVNDNFITPDEALDKKENKKIFPKVKKVEEKIKKDNNKES